MGALRNAVKRKTHKERSQPLARRKYGLLEKKKDYKLRAKDYHRKQEALKALRTKADERNPDEFYFSMESAQTKDGVHIKESATANKYSQEELRLMKTQDIKYVALKAQQETKKVEKLQERLHHLGSTTQSKHTLFVDDESELRQGPVAQQPHSIEPSSMGSYGTVAVVAKQPGSTPLAQDSRLAERLERSRAALYKELSERTMRRDKLLSVANGMTLQRELMGKETLKKLPAKDKSEKPVYKWCMERKK